MKALLGRLTLGIQARLVILVLATVLPLVGLASATILRTVDDDRARIQRDVRERAEHLLAPIYGWFTEGFNTVDLKEGKRRGRRTGVSY